MHGLDRKRTNHSYVQHRRRFVANSCDLSLVCAPSPCANGAQCLLLNANTDYYCSCPGNLPLGGKNCDQLVLPTTLPRESTLQSCCILVIHLVAVAVTPAPTSPCASAPCLNAGVCTPNALTNSYTCACNQVAYGLRCERTRRSTRASFSHIRV